MRTKTYSILGLGITLALAGCGSGGKSSDGKGSGPVSGDWNAVVAAAKKEGSVLLYSSQNPVNLKVLQEAFAKQYPGIKMEFVRGTDAEMNPKVEVEQRTGKGAADVHMVTDPAWITNDAKTGTYSTNLVAPALGNAAYDKATSVLNDRFALVSAAVFSLGWNKDAVPNGLKNPNDILKPEYTGKIGITNPQGISAYVDFYKYLDKNFGPDYLQQLAKFKPRIYPSALGIAQALTSGEISVTPVVQPLVNEVDAGAPVGWALPNPPWGTPWYVHALKSAPHPNAAQVLVDFMLTEPGQIALNKGYAAVLPDVKGSVARAQDIKLPDPTQLTPELNQKFQATWEGLFLGH